MRGLFIEIQISSNDVEKIVVCRRGIVGQKQRVLY